MILGIGITDPLTQITMIDNTSIGCVCWCDRFANNNFFPRDLLSHNLKHRSSTKERPRLIEQGLIGIILSITLIVELNVVEVNSGANFLVNSVVATIFIEILLEVGCLGGMSDDMVGKDFSQLPLEGNQPCLPCSSFHRTVILPINVHTIKVILQHKVPQLCRTVNRIHSSSSGKLRGSESTHHNFHTIIVVLFLQSLLNFIFGAAPWIVVSKIVERVSPNIHNIKGSRGRPKSQDNEVVDSGVSIAWYADSSSNFLRRPPLINFIYISQSNRIVKLFPTLSLHDQAQQKNNAQIFHIHIIKYIIKLIAGYRLFKAFISAFFQVFSLFF